MRINRKPIDIDIEDLRKKFEAIAPEKIAGINRERANGYYLYMAGRPEYFQDLHRMPFSKKNLEKVVSAMRKTGLLSR